MKVKPMCLLAGLSALVLALPAVALEGPREIAPGVRVNLEKKDWAKDFILTCRVSFSKGAPRQMNVRVFYPQFPTDAPEKWRSINAGIDFCHWTRVLGWVSGEGCGTPFFTKEFMDVGVLDDEWRKVVVVSHDGYVSFFLEMNGKLQRTMTVRPQGDFLCAGVSVVPEKGGTVKDLKLQPFSDKYLPKGRTGFEVARTPKTVEIPVTGDVTCFDFVPGGYPVSIAATFRGGTNACTASFVSFSQDFEHKLYNVERRDKDGNALFQSGKAGGRKRIADSGMDFSCAGIAFPIYTITKMGSRFGGVQIYNMLTNLSAYGEVASKHVFKCEVRKLADGPRLYVDGDFCCKLPMKDVEKVSLRLPEGACWRVGGLGQRSRSTVEGNLLSEPIFFDKPFDTSVCRVNLGNHALECDGYLSRCPQEADPTSFLRRIPVGTYLRARVRCKLGGDTNRNTCVTARITNFYSPNTAGRNPECLDQQTKEIPRGTKGEVELVFDFNPGAIQDVIWQRGFKDLTFEVLGDCTRRHAYFDQGYLHPCGKSDVIVLGATLERSPAGLCVANANNGNLFYENEQPGFKVTAEALIAGDYTVDWSVEDVYGKPCGTAKDELTLAAGERRTFDRTFPYERPGWYGVTAALKDAKGLALVTHRASYVLLAPDTRKAGYESPWFSWTDIRMNNRSPQAFTNAMDLCRRGGIRHAQPGAYGEKEASAWGITCTPLPRIPFSEKPTLEAREAEYEQAIRAQMTRFPHANAATVFHESYSKTRRGQKPDTKADAEEVRKGTELCRVWRRLYPNVRLVLGNSGDGIDKMDQLFRAGFPKDLIDTIGEESVGGSMPSEKTVAEHFMALKDLAKEYGYDHVGVEACYEWKTRQRRNYDSPRLVAAMTVRDALIALAWGSKNITVDMSPDSDGCYFTTSWGGGSHSKKPEFHPHPTAAAVATLTLVLDRCVFSRLVPTGSETVYAVEYKNPDGAYVTALWTSKGGVKARLEGASRRLKVVDLYGASREVTAIFRADADVLVSEEPQYVLSSAPLKSVTLASPNRDYAFERQTPADGWTKLTGGPAEAWTVYLKQMPGMNATEGKGYTLADVTDTDRGPVLELTRGPENKGRTIGGLRAKQPFAVPADATTLGVWIRGNASRGEIYFEIEDAAGDKFYSTSRSWMPDWGEQVALDYDGWRLVRIPLRNTSPVVIHSPNAWVDGLWRCSNYSKKQMVWPIKVRGVSFVWGDQVVHVNEKHDVKNQSVRIGGFVAY